MKLLTKTMHLPLLKNSNFAFFFFYKNLFLLSLKASFLSRISTNTFSRFFWMKTKEKKKLFFWPNHGLAALKKCQGCLFLKSMFLLCRQASFLTKTLRNTFLLFILHKKQSWRNLKLLTKTMDLPLWKNSNLRLFIKICSSCLERLVFYLERQQTLFLGLFFIKTKEKKRINVLTKSWTMSFEKISRLPTLKSMFYCLDRLVF